MCTMAIVMVKYGDVDDDADDGSMVEFHGAS